MSEEFIIRLVDDAKRMVTGSSGSTDASSAVMAGELASGGSSSKGMGLNGLIKLIGIASIGIKLLSLIGDAIGRILKPIYTIVGGIFKLIAQLLRPIADILIVLLQPILMFLRPLVKTFNETMRPFRKVAFDLMKEGNKSGDIGVSSLFSQLATQTLMAGFTASIATVIGELLKSLITTINVLLQQFVIFPLLDILEPIISFFGGNVDLIKENIKTSMDTAAADASSAIDIALSSTKIAMLSGIGKMAEDIINGSGEGEGKKGGVTDAVERIQKTIDGAKTNLKTSLEEAIKDLFRIKVPKRSSEKGFIVNEGKLEISDKDPYERARINMGLG